MLRKILRSLLLIALIVSIGAKASIPAFATQTASNVDNYYNRSKGSNMLV